MNDALISTSVFTENSDIRRASETKTETLRGTALGRNWTEFNTNSFRFDIPPDTLIARLIIGDTPVSYSLYQGPITWSYADMGILVTGALSKNDTEINLSDSLSSILPGINEVFIPTETYLQICITCSTNSYNASINVMCPSLTATLQYATISI